ncbi:hypothetical protein [Actinoallomurus acanthiterrae]
MSVVVGTDDGEACLYGDLIYDIEGSLLRHPDETAAARMQPCAFATHELALTHNFTTSILEEIGASQTDHAVPVRPARARRPRRARERNTDRPHRSNHGSRADLPDQRPLTDSYVQGERAWPHT